MSFFLVVLGGKIPFCLSPILLYHLRLDRIGQVSVSKYSAITGFLLLTGQSRILLAIDWLVSVC